MTVSLYTMGAEYQRLIDLAENAGTQEDEQMFLEACRVLQGDIVEKCDRCAAVMATLDAEAEALKHEQARLYARQKSIESNRSRLTRYVQDCMTDAKIDRAKGPRFTLIIVENPPAVVIDDQKKLDAIYWKMPEPTVARSAILADLKAGKVVAGAHLEREKSLRIR